ncbi:M23 family metallopeptidase, partial [Propylenella binzhouense]
ALGLGGGALQAAVGLGPGAVLAPTFEAARPGALASAGGVAVKGDRMRPVPETEIVRRVIPVSTVTRVGDRDIVRVRPFAHVASALSAPVAPEIAARIPDFNPLKIFSGSDEPTEVAASDAIYGAEVDGEVAIKVSDFPSAGIVFDDKAELALAEVRRSVREAAPFLADGAVEVASLPYIDSARFEIGTDATDAISSLAVAIVPENVSLVEKSEDPQTGVDVDERIVSVGRKDSFERLLADAGATEEEAEDIAAAFSANFSVGVKPGEKLRFGLAADADGRTRPVRISLYGTDSHLGTVAMSDTGSYVAAEEPPFDESVFAEDEPAPAAGNLPTLYAGLWGTGLSLGMPQPLIEDLVKVFSYDVDLQAHLSPADSMEVVYESDGDETESAEILYASVTLGGVPRRFYRFRTADDGVVDYYDEEGKSAKKFLMRKPIAGGRFSSPFGMRRHPILGRYRLHSGVDWAAPRGTPIMASGNGVVEFAGTKSGYGRQVRIRHANGYETAYGHMSAIGKGITEGVRVRQGQIIGYVGSSGLSTGSHVHYEVLVNDRFVDPMKIRVPRGRTLQGSQLAKFERERGRIDALIARDNGDRYADTRS